MIFIAVTVADKNCKTKTIYNIIYARAPVMTTSGLCQRSAAAAVQTAGDNIIKGCYNIIYAR